ncbi:UDP-N-acetylmuramate dehydrogenase [Lysinibacillus fusiformis]|jgi:UDP-N-acetylmuramate dehydrogenase|uniref:UDP-N-acetylmuramate dehydrogenase n=1 Tax=Lysinibacillus TaxID=400634 RepID=UPI0004D78ABE|nr:MULTISPECIES: UDP-N-acetylmuramate dehydrogenase [Lysinibacillus]AXQ50695.1 UDP-N-acetylmuramate dehydrogenase [Stenotrophomonas rhizophila]AJK86164.1 UDP-N-acetylenolpyruvoylglucosamine reductase [Lysinibacillus fusiformis]KAB0445514.1 UDP-N-acetylenolpyruvoylglucosamine reductase [Lysinibacillus fusiformis]KGA81799.1 UDP-N-acetylenolpyruvoylglucosamine reductase [Lysinibacillus fusiformis]KHK55672.1 UDP-N-acetylenolpyruvoylglucosamine reductase [Lysinibacillus sp. A1]
MTKQQWAKDLAKSINPANIKLDESLQQYTMTKLGGKADVFVLPDTEEEAAFVIHYAYINNIPLLMLGNGSNMVVRDGGHRGIVVTFSNLDEIRINGEHVYAQSGALIKDVSKLSAKASLTGFEFACGIPGSIGGAMAMNAGAYGGEIKDIIISSKVLTKEGEILTLSKDELELGYRKSVIAKKGYYVLSSEFQLASGEQGEIDAKIADLTFQRESKQPLEYPSAGSVFKRPPGHFAGKLIQDSGLQGKGVGGAEVSTKHAGFIVNKGNATASDYIATIQMVQRIVKEKFGIELETEVKIVGDDL